VDELISDPRFYYLFACFDKKTMTFLDPIFLVPSSVVHRQARPKLSRGYWWFIFYASLEPGARDRFSKYRVSKNEVGKVLLQILRDLERPQGARRLTAERLDRLPGVLWTRAKSRRAPRRRAA
jgi:hypothetical protein